MSFVGSYIDPEVVKQLELRAKIQGKEKDRTPSEIHYLSSRQAWVRMISGVDIAESNEPAKQYIISNGTRKFKGTIFNQDTGDYEDTFGVALRSGINFENNQGTELYRYNQNTGVRPFPGITGFSIVSKNRFGTIREATVSFVVWSLEDLNIVENLYFRPGYTAIVEWGHTLFIGENDEVEIYGKISSVSEIIKKRPITEVADYIEGIKKQTFFNYDGFIGYVKNFNWSFRSDGAYDCSVSIISAGEILESLKMSFSNTEEAVIEKEENSSNKSNFLSLFTSELESINGLPTSGEEGTNIVTLLDLPENSSITNFFTKYGYSSSTPLALVANTDEGFFRSGKIGWIPLRVLLDLINGTYLPNVEGDLKRPYISFDTKSNQKFYTFNGHHSLNPFNTLIDTELYTILTLRDDLRKVITGTDKDSILNIFISTRLIGEKVQKILDGGEVTVLSFVRDILDEVQIALGSVNEFDIHYRESDFKYEIVDRKKINKDQQNIPPPILKLTGKESIYSEINIQSKVSSALSAQISISAQASSNNSTNTINSMLTWNAGLTDRYVREKKVGSQEKSKETKDTNYIVEAIRQGSKTFWSNTFNLLTFGLYEYASTTVENWSKVYKAIQNYRNSFEAIRNKTFTNINNQNVNFFGIGRNFIFPLATIETIIEKKNEQIEDYPDDIKTLILKGKEIFNRSPEVKVFEDEELKTAEGIIPVELSLTTDGIGGFKIGETFSITPGILPIKYDPLGYIITGLDHSIENNKWKTTVKAQTFIFPETIKIPQQLTPQEDIPVQPQPTQPILPEPVPSPTPVPSSPVPAPTSAVSTDEKAFWTLVAICSREDNNSQGQADVAQSIYNRVAIGKSFYETNIVTQITTHGQYEPTWQFPKNGIKDTPNKEWKEIVDLQTASIACGVKPDILLNIAKALKDKQLQQQAQLHVQGRTDFFGAGSKGIIRMEQVVFRSNRSNAFGFRWGYQPKDTTGKPIPGIPANVPDFVNTVKLPIG
jgi:hypothetical protein